MTRNAHEAAGAWNIPQNWTWTIVGNVGEVGLGRQRSPINHSGPHMRPYVRAANVTWTGWDLSDVNEMNFDAADFARFQLLHGDVVLNEGSGSAKEVGKSAIWRNEIANCCFQNTLLRVQPKACTSEYLHAYFSLAARSGLFVGETQGVNIFHIGKDGLVRFPVPLPPLPEQRRIVAKLDALDASSKRARADLDRIPALVARAKQAILAKAFRGDLTAEIAVERKPRPVDRHLMSSMDLDESERGEWDHLALPLHWEWRRFDALFNDVTDSRRKLPTKDYRVSGKFPVVDQGATNIAGWSDREDMVQLAAPPFLIFGDHTRCIKMFERTFIQGADGVKVLTPKSDCLLGYLFFALMAVRLPDKGYSRHMKFLRATVFPWCPLNEQREIVRRIESAFAKIDRMAAEAASASKLLDRLDQALLAKAFRGELVPQNPEDEPAEKLLARITKARGAAPKTTRRRKTRG